MRFWMICTEPFETMDRGLGKFTDPVGASFAWLCFILPVWQPSFLLSMDFALEKFPLMAYNKHPMIG